MRLDSFIIDFNRRFARPAKYPKDLHRPVLESSEDLDDIFAWQESRKLSKTLTFRYDKMIYLVEPTEENTRIAGEKSQFTTTQMVRWRLNMATDHSIIRSSINWNASTRGKSLITNGSVLY